MADRSPGDGNGWKNLTPGQQSDIVETLKREKKTLAVINEFAISLISIANHSDLAWYVARQVVGRLGFVDCVFYLLDPERNVLRQIAAIGDKIDDKAHGIVNLLEIPLGDGVTGHVAETGKAEIVGDLTSDDRYIPDVTEARSEICVPIWCNGKISGVIDCEHPEPNAFSGEDLKTLTTIAALAGAKLEVFEKDVSTSQSKSARETENRLRTIMETCPFAVGVSTVDTGEILYANPRAAEMFGTTPEEMPGRGSLDFWVNESDRFDFVRQFNREGRASANEVRLRKANGDEYWAHEAWEAIPLFGKNAVLFWVYDVSHIREANERLTDALRNAETANNAKSKFLASMSHELRTPLNAILGFSQMLEIDPRAPLTPEQQASVENIKLGGEHLLSLVNQVLDLSKIESDTLDIAIDSIDPGDVFADCSAIAKTMAADRALSFFDKTEDQSHPRIDADASILRQILLNLLSNAAKYNKPGGQFSLEAMAGEEHMLRIRVSDTGQGIDAKHHKDVFEPFDRLGREASNIEGSGIGLTIAKQLATRMNCRIGFESVAGEGSTFWLDVPRSGTN